MPNATVMKMAAEAGISKSQAEYKWDKAKALAAESDHEEDWPYVMGIFKRMLGFKEESILESEVLGYRMVKASVLVTESLTDFNNG